jgi:hypothetical protein
MDLSDPILDVVSIVIGEIIIEVAVIDIKE